MPGFRRHPLAYILPAAFVFLYLQLFILPFTPVFAWGDQAIFLDEATRMLRGEALYRDFFEFVYPGIDTVYFVLFRLFRPRAWIPDAALIVIGMSLTWLIVSISRKLIGGAAAFLSGLLFLTLPFRSLLDGTHHWYSTLAVMAALVLVLEKRSGARWAMVGSLCGLAAWFNQSRGAAAVLAFGAFLVWEARQQGASRRSILGREASLFAAFVATVGALSAYFVCKAGFGRFWYCTVSFVLKYYPSEPYNNWRAYLGIPPHFHPWVIPFDLTIWFSIHVLIPLVYVLFFVRYGRERDLHRAEPWDRLMLVNLVGIFLFLGVLPSPSYSRLCSVSPPGIILLIWFATRPGRLERLMARLLWVAVCVLAIVEPVIRQGHWRAYVDLPSGRTAYLDARGYERFLWISRRVHPGEFFFGDPFVCFAMGLREPAEVAYVVASDYTRPEQVQGVINGLERNRARWFASYSDPNVPSAHNQGTDHLGPLRAYIHSHYHLTKRFPTGEQVWERNQ